MNSVPCCAAARANRRPAATISLVGGVLHAQLDDVHAGGQDGAQEIVWLLGADQVQAGGVQAFAAVGHGSKVWQEPAREPPAPR